MKNSRFLRKHFRLFMSSRLLPVICLGLSMALWANAATYPQAVQEIQATPNTSIVIDAVVSEVQGTKLSLVGGLVIDISNAYLYSFADGFLPASSIKAGTGIRASINASDNGSAALVAESVRVRLENEIVFSGLLQNADIESGVLTLMNQRILINSETILPVGFKHKKLKAGLPLSIITKPVGSELVAILIMPNTELPKIFP